VSEVGEVKKVRIYKILIALSLVLLVAACAKDYVTGKRTFTLYSEADEIKLGKEADPQIVAEYGAYDDDGLVAYVNSVGQEIAKVSHRPELSYTFRVVDSPVINAFALPGGYVYFTRGILAHFNSEDELAGVMGHEIGHITARHGIERMSQAQIIGGSLQIGAALSETFQKYSGIAAAGVGLVFLKYGRDQESESDRLGVEYSTKIGYDSHRMAGFFRTLAGMREGSGQSLPSFLSTHPDPGDREVRVNQLTDEWRGQIDYKPLNKDPNDYLERIDGIVYGPNPRHGYVEKNQFYHPDLAFQFPVPDKWQLINSASTVMIVSPEKDAVIEFGFVNETSAGAAADKFVAEVGEGVQRRESVSVHGFPAQAVESVLMAQDQQLRMLSYFIEKDAKVYAFHGYTYAEKYNGYAGSFRSVMAGFDKVTDKAVLSKKPVRLRIEKAPRAGTLESVLSEMGMPSSKRDELALLNGRKAGDRVEQGDLLKVIRQQ